MLLVVWFALLLAASHAVSASTGRDAPSAGAAAQAAVAAPAHEPPVPLLWKVSDADNAIYLLGSFHLLKAGDYPVSEDIEQAFAAAERVVFEVAPEQLDAPDTGQRFLAAAGYENGRSLSKVMPSRLYEKLRRLLARQGQGIAQIEAYEPWFVNLSLLLGLARSLEFSPDQGLDRYLIGRATKAGKPTAGLETLQDQLDALDATPLDEQLTSLREFLDRPQEMPGLLDELHQAWRDGDVEALDVLTRRDMREKTPETYRLLNVERNDRWVPALQAMLDDNGDDALVVVGALHLLGDDGVVEKLRDAGYDVERICSACEAEPVTTPDPM
ncbi:hypothetical protein N799_08865 [Lysobacter arseniciresistens ZS79]|uniref:Polysaccharide biosynthesis protein GumN n=1 Tax=Lysobacter arseniciresistens ZS79 TaxID=913325 RepID=A0A0A0ETF6_9GAMM|nr:hypothetical protein N799_08865 [Lysobacter arseniciresistens ZS79]